MKRFWIRLLPMIIVGFIVSPAWSEPLGVKQQLDSFIQQGQEITVAYSLEVNNQTDGVLTELRLVRSPGLFYAQNSVEISIDRLQPSEKRVVAVSFSFPNIMQEEQARGIPLEWMVTGLDSGGSPLDFPVTSLPVDDISAE